MTSGKQLFLTITVLIILSFILFFHRAEARNEEWKAIARKNGEERILYDPNSVVRHGQETFRVWIISFDKDHSPRRSLEDIDCSNRIYRDIEVIDESSDKPFRHTFTPSEWRGIDSESARGELTRILCR